MAEMGKRVLVIGCDPKSDTTSLLFGGIACPTITLASLTGGTVGTAYSQFATASGGVGP